MPGNRGRIFFFIIYLVFGLYFLNVPFSFIDLPAVNDWVVFAGGVLLIIGAFRALRRPPIY